MARRGPTAFGRQSHFLSGCRDVERQIFRRPAFPSDEIIETQERRAAPFAGFVLIGCGACQQQAFRLAGVRALAENVAQCRSSFVKRVSSRIVFQQTREKILKFGGFIRICRHGNLTVLRLRFVEAGRAVSR